MLSNSRRVILLIDGGDWVFHCVILLAGMNEMFTLPIGASQTLNYDRVKYKSVD